MPLEKLGVCCALLAMVPASRVVTGESTSTTMFTVKGYHNLLYSELKCYARGDLKVRSADGTIVSYADDGAEMQLRDNTGFANDPTNPVSVSDWRLGARRVATANVEVVDSSDRHFPDFICFVYNEKKSPQVQCGTTSRNVRSIGTSAVCDVEITDSNPRVRVMFKIHVWLWSANQAWAKKPRFHCYGETDLTVEAPDQTPDHVENPNQVDQRDQVNMKTVKKGQQLIKGGTPLQCDSVNQTTGAYETNIFLTFNNFNEKYDGFTCWIMDNGRALKKCGSNVESWDKNIEKRQQKKIKPCGLIIMLANRD